MAERTKLAWVQNVYSPLPSHLGRDWGYALLHRIPTSKAWERHPKQTTKKIVLR